MHVNRSLDDDAMDRIDHALGRPLDPMAPTFRDHYAIDLGNPERVEMQASPHWRLRMVDDHLAWFVVTDEGRMALRDHLKAIGDPHRAWAITYAGHTWPVVAASRAKARYSAFLDIADTDPDLRFSAFCRCASVRLA